jgi:hypothetical protein
MHIVGGPAQIVGTSALAAKSHSHIGGCPGSGNAYQGPRSTIKD